MSAPLSILHLEDDPLDSELMRELLVQDGMEARFERVDTLPRLREALERGGHSLILSDYTLPHVDPLEALHTARELRPEVPFIFVSGTLGEDLAIEMLKRGASDYVLKHRLARLVPAVRRALEEARVQAERKQAEEDLRDLNETLEQRVIERTALAERRTAQLRVLSEELIQAEQRERQRVARILHDHLQQLLVAAKIKISLTKRRPTVDNVVHALAEIDELLDQSLRESRSLTVELSPPVLEDAGLAAGLRWLGRRMGEKHGLPVEVETAPDTEPDDENTRVFLFHAVRELLLNVVKHAHAGSARVELSCVGGPLRVAVSDTGVGFDPQKQEEYGQSSGFGLFSLHERLEMLGGRLEIDTLPGAGTLVAIEVPRCRGGTPRRSPAQTAQNAAPLAAGHVDHPGGEPTPAAHVRVLLADDHPIIRRGLAGSLREHVQIEIVGEAADGQEALDLAVRTRPDVVLMDVTMPRLNGIQATRRILESLPQTRVIGLSMHDEADMSRAMLKAGAVAYLPKDVAFDTLLGTILAK